MDQPLALGGRHDRHIEVYYCVIEVIMMWYVINGFVQVFAVASGKLGDLF